MKGGLKPQGFTIVETLIFLAISAGLFISVVRYLSGQQARAEFSYGIQEFSTRISDITNDVSTGYYDKVGDLRCEAASPGAPTFPAGSTAQGASKDCIFIGRVIQFDPDGIADIPDNQGYTVYSVVGRRTTTISGSKKREVQNLSDSYTVPIAPPFAPDSTISSVIPNGIKVRWVRYATVENGAPTTDVGAVGIFTNFGAYNLNSGSTNVQSVRNVQIIPVPGTLMNRNIPSTSASINNMRTIATPPPGTLPVPKGGVTACLESANGNMFALIVIGGNIRQTTSDIEIRTGTC